MKRIGFTLAELLVVLAVIGIVAMLTIPSLMQSYQKKTWVTQLQKSLSTWQNGFAQMMAADEVEKFDETEFSDTHWTIVNCFGCAINQEHYEKSMSVLKKYFKISKWEQITNGNYCFYNLNDASQCTVDAPVIKIWMSDNSTAYFYIGSTPGKDLNAWMGSILIDVNGDKEPNTWGRDVFKFDVFNNGTIIPFGRQNQFTSEKCTSSDSRGDFCAIRIIDNGWVMDY